MRRLGRVGQILGRSTFARDAATSSRVLLRPFGGLRLGALGLASLAAVSVLTITFVTEAQEAKVAAPPSDAPLPPKGDLGGQPDPETKKHPPAWETAKAERRSGFAMGLSLGSGIGEVTGYPNDDKKVGRRAYYQKSGVGIATGSSLWLGGALTDWFNFGLGLGFSNIYSKGKTSAAPYALFHDDFYPLYPLKGRLRDLGVTLDFGLGFPKTVDTKTKETVIGGGGSSFIYTGVFWEPVKFWRLRFGPTVGFHYLFNQSVHRPVGLAGVRLTLYVGP